MMYVYSNIEIDQLLTVYRNQSVESKSVEIFDLSLINVFGVKSDFIFILLTVRTYSVMTYIEKVLVSNI
jgi:hypothetical protein